MTVHPRLVAASIVCLVLMGCREASVPKVPAATPTTAQPTVPAAAPTTAQPSVTGVESTAPQPTADGPRPTLPPLPQATLVPGPAASSPATHTVCADGCDYSTIQQALDAVVAGAVIEVRSTVHTEAGIVVDGNVTIRGIGVDATMLQAADAAEEAPDRVFLVEEGSTLVLQDLTLRHGRPTMREEWGGGILNEGTLTIRECVISDNLAGGGAGIANNGALTVINSTIRDNTAEDIGAPGLQCGSGGGILSRTGLLTVIGSTIHGNRAGTRSRGTGGGIRIGCTCGAIIANSTISGNESKRYGGGVVAIGRLRMVHCTLSDNRSPEAGTGLYFRSQLDLENTLIAGNRGPGAECFLAGPDTISPARGSFGAKASNWIGDASCDPAHTGDPLLGPLADNGGPTWTHALLPGSEAIDSIPVPACPLGYDQRGETRPLYVSSLQPVCDIGAFELQP